MEITLESPLDMHLHLRDGDMLKLVAPLSADFAGAVIMPNLVPPVTDPGAMVAYGERIATAMGDTAFTRYMTLFFTKQNEQQLLMAKETPGFFGYKLYPAGITTNSEGGVSDIDQADKTLRIMEENCAKYPNFVISSGCDIPPMTPWANINAFFETVDEFYGK